LIKIGIECTFEKLRCDILTHPDRYFFVLLTDDQATLCIRTCNSQGEDIRAHIIDGLLPDSNGNLVSVFEEGIKDALIERKHSVKRSCEGYEYSISAPLEEKITRMPGLIDWIMTTVLTEERHILINPSWVV
jgi:hypothetical protein